MFRYLRKFVAVLLAIWLPLISGNALAVSIMMQSMSGDRHTVAAQSNAHNASTAHHHDQMSIGQDQAADQQEQSSSPCKDYGVCHFACSGFLAAIAIMEKDAVIFAQTFETFSTQFQSFTSAPLDPPPLARV